MDTKLRDAVLLVITSGHPLAAAYLAVKDAVEVKSWSLQQKYEQELGHEMYLRVEQAIKEAKEAAMDGSQG